MLTMKQGGRIRRAVEATCERCGVVFLKRADSYGKHRPQKYCSVECRALARRQRVEVVCAKCGEKFETTTSKATRSKSGLVFCSKKCKDEASRIDGGVAAVWPDHYGQGASGGVRDRSDVLAMLRDGCVDCGEVRRYLITVHHMDGDRGHNDISNFEVVCWNHHIMRHLKLIDDEWVFDTKALTPRDKLAELKGP